MFEFHYCSAFEQNRLHLVQNYIMMSHNCAQNKPQWSLPRLPRPEPHKTITKTCQINFTPLYVPPLRLFLFKFLITTN